MAVTFDTLGDILKRRYTEDYINEWNRLRFLTGDGYKPWKPDLDEELKRAEEITFDSLLEDL